MDPFQMVVIIVIVTVGARVFQNYVKLKQHTAADLANHADFERMTNEVARLKERVRVLEKIVTDSDQRLREEISRLA